MILRHQFRPFRRIVFLLVPGLIVGIWVAPIAADDYSYLGKHIEAQQSLVATLAGRHDHADHRLLEPLLGLARAQTRANRFEDANKSLEHAMQVVRIRDGLYAASQYSILEQSINNNVLRGAWKNVDEQLNHLQWLYADRFEGSVEEQIERLMWASEAYFKGVFNDLESRQVKHLKNATRLNRLAFQLAERQDQISLQSRIRITYNLVKAYHLEAQGIRHGGSVGMEIRSKAPESGRLEDRRVSLRKRYAAGLDLLENLREHVRLEGPDNVEALVLMDLSIADWQLLFNRREALDEYPRLYRRLVAAGIDPSRLDVLFASPVALPQAQLFLDLEAALAGQDPGSREPLILVQRSANFPGIIAAGATLDSALPGRVSDSYIATEVELRMDPFSSSSNWLSGTLRTNWGTAADVRLVSVPSDRQLASQISTYLHEVHMRPVLIGGELQQVEMKVRYLVPGNRAVREYSVLDPVQLSQL